MMSLNYFTRLVVVCLMVGICAPLKAQYCKGYGEKACSRYLDDYKPNPQDNTASLGPGESAELSIVFYRGHDYRLVFCSEEHLGELGIRIKSSKGEVLFDNGEHDMAFHWDFTMTKTQRLVIEVTAPGEAEDENAIEGCVSITLGLRPSIKKGFN